MIQRIERPVVNAPREPAGDGAGATESLRLELERCRRELDDCKRTEAQLRRSVACLAEAQRLSRTGSFGWSAATGDLIWSDETSFILGYDRARKPTLDLVLNRVHPEDLPLVQQAVDRATREGADLELEHRLLMPDGKVKQVHVLARAAKTNTGAVEFVGAVMDVTERKLAQEARRAAEHLARGQLDALTHTLEALAQESDPDRLLEHVLRTVAEQSGAHSVSVWNRNGDGGWLDLVAEIEDGRFRSGKDAVHPAKRVPILGQNHPAWGEVLRTGQHGVLEVIDPESARMRVGSDPDATWHRLAQDADPDPALSRLKQHLRGLGIRAVLFVPMRIAGRVAGIIGVRFQHQRTFRREELELTRALAHQAMLAIQLMRLSQQSREVAVTAERNRLARDIHDTLAQGFTGVIVQLEAAADATAKGLAEEAEDHLGRAADLARESLNEARRSVRALRPQALEEKDLGEALEGLIQKMTAGTSVRADFRVQGTPRRLSPDWEDHLLRIGQEVLTNALRHARASAFKTQLVFAPGEIRLDLRDNGCGFDPAGPHDGFGWVGIRERVEAMGGQITIQSANGEGTALSIVLPIPHPPQPSES